MIQKVFYKRGCVKMMHPLLLCLKINLVLQIKPEHLHIHRHLG